MTRNLLLISNSTLHSSGYLGHCEANIREFLAKRKTVIFVPFARPGGISHDGYTKVAWSVSLKWAMNCRAFMKS